MLGCAGGVGLTYAAVASMPALFGATVKLCSRLYGEIDLEM